MFILAVVLYNDIHDDKVDVYFLTLRPSSSSLIYPFTSIQRDFSKPFEGTSRFLALFKQTYSIKPLDTLTVTFKLPGKQDSSIRIDMNMETIHDCFRENSIVESIEL